MGAHNERLRLVVGNTSDAEVSLHGLHIIRKLGAEGAVFYVVNGAVKAFLSVDGHAAAPCTEVRVIIRAKEKIKDTILFECRCKDASHGTFLSECAYRIPCYRKNHNRFGR